MKLKNAKSGKTVEFMPHIPTRTDRALADSDGMLGPRILVFDIETTPMLSWHWRCFKENISPVQIVKFTRVLCWAAKWLDNDCVMFDSTQRDGEDDKRCCKTLWKLCNDADILVAHNGRAFDMGTLRARWLAHYQEPPAPSRWVDTLRVARGRFRFPSNRLDGIARYLGLGSKLGHEGFQLWLDCMTGDKAAWSTMEEYNINDVLLDEEVYLKIRAWDSQHPNVSLLYGDGQDRCVVCGGRNFKALNQKAYTAASEFDARRCVTCKTVMRSRKRTDRRASHATIA